MVQRRLSKIAAGLLFGIVLLNPGAARADERTEARGHFKKGMAAIADGRYDAGIEELKTAYEILPHPNVLYNIARAYVDMGDLDNAIVYYRKYLEGGPKDRDEVAQIITSLEERTRKQQAMLLETQQAQTPAGGPGTGPGGTGPGAGTLPGGTTGPGATGAPGLGGKLAGGPSAGALKTEEVFEETVVTASKEAQSPLDAPSSTSIITEQDIRLSGIISIPELLRRLAGVDVMEITGGQAEVSMRGFNQRLSNKVLVLIDGRSFYVDLLGSTIWSTLPIGVEDIERIEVVRGPGSALYGADAFNGVVNIITKAPGKGSNGVNVGYGEHKMPMAASGRPESSARRRTACRRATTTCRAGAAPWRREPSASPRWLPTRMFPPPEAGSRQKSRVTWSVTSTRASSLDTTTGRPRSRRG